MAGFKIGLPRRIVYFRILVFERSHLYVLNIVLEVFFYFFVTLQESQTRNESKTLKNRDCFVYIAIKTMKLVAMDQKHVTMNVFLFCFVDLKQNTTTSNVF